MFNIHFISISRIQFLWKFKSRWFSSNYRCSPSNSNTSSLIVGWSKMRNFKINLSFVDCQGRNSDNVTVTNNDLRLVWPQIGVLCILDLHKSYYRPRASAAAYLWQLNYLRVPSLIIESWRFWGTELTVEKLSEVFIWEGFPYILIVWQPS